MDDKTRQALAEMSKHFVCFSRNGRWGTCGDCPRDTVGNPYPEFCVYTSRGDHKLDIEDLSSQWKIRTRDKNFSDWDKG